MITRGFWAKKAHDLTDILEGSFPLLCEEKTVDKTGKAWRPTGKLSK